MAKTTPNTPTQTPEAPKIETPKEKTILELIELVAEEAKKDLMKSYLKDPIKQKALKEQSVLIEGKQAVQLIEDKIIALQWSIQPELERLEKELEAAKGKVSELAKEKGLHDPYAPVVVQPAPALNESRKPRKRNPSFTEEEVYKYIASKEKAYKQDLMQHFNTTTATLDKKLNALIDGKKIEKKKNGTSITFKSL